jgi:hypothetical protein
VSDKIHNTQFLRAFKGGFSPPSGLLLLAVSSILGRTRSELDRFPLSLPLSILVILIKMLSMLDQVKLLWFDEILACMIQSSFAMEEAFRALAPDPRHLSRVSLLTGSLDKTRVLLSRVLSNPFFNARFHLQNSLNQGGMSISLKKLRRKR